MHRVNSLSSRETGYKLLSNLYPTYKTKENKHKNQSFKWAVQFLAIFPYTLDDVKQINGQRGMVYINLQKAFANINNKILFKKHVFF